jgi:hypothetical protein
MQHLDVALKDLGLCRSSSSVSQLKIAERLPSQALNLVKLFAGASSDTAFEEPSNVSIGC